MPSFNTKSVYQLLTVTSMRSLYLLTTAGVLMITSGWWYLLYQPAIASVDQTRIALNTMNQQLHTLKKTEREIATLTNSITTLQTNLKEYAHKQSRTEVIQHALALIADTAQRNNMFVNGCRLCNQHDKAWCSLHQITFDCKGTFEQFITFFDALKKSKLMIECDKCNLVRNDNEAFTLHAVFDVLYT
jgi:methylthioribose-1-phosphate isomerase